MKMLKNTAVRKATGYDLIPPKVLRLNAEAIAYPLTCLINDMFHTSTFPTMLKCAEIGPLHKKSSMLDKVNFRPLSVLTAISKIFEKNIDIQMKVHAELVFSHILSAYRKHYSTQHVLIQVTENIRKCLDSKMESGLVLTDLSKAFDALPHDFIVAKLAAYKFDKKAAMLISSYLRHRSQRVKLGDIHSNWLHIKRGVPQGSIVGPTLFNYFLNDLLYLQDDFIVSNYADDNTIFASAPCTETLLDKLTRATDIALRWFKSNCMLANATKFQFIVFGNKPEPLSLPVQNSNLQNLPHVKLLGVTLDHKLNFNDHIRNICRKTAWQLAAFGRIAKYLDVQARLTIFRSFIESNFQYCKVVWHFCSKSDTKRLEKQLERGLRLVFQDFSSDYEFLLAKAELSSLRESRLRSLLVEVHNAVNEISPLYIQKLFQVHVRPS